MNTVTDFLFVRHRHNWIQLLRFALVGGSGVVVNLVVFIAVSKLGPDHNEALFGIPFTKRSFGYQHLFSTIAFFVANLWNFQLNRSWTFKTGKHAHWFKEWVPFMAVGFGAQIITMIIETLLVKPTSPVALPSSIFTGDSGLTNPSYWAHAIAILVTVPLTFVINKLWTFSAARAHHRHDHHHPEPVDMDAVTPLSPSLSASGEIDVTPSANPTPAPARPRQPDAADDLDQTG